MDKILGLGKAGCNIARAFEKYSQYTVVKIDSEPSMEKGYLQMRPQKTPELYEEKCPDFSSHLSSLSGDLLFIVSGASIISGAALKILSQVKDFCDISVLYIRPDVELLGDLKKKQERMVFHVFQEYARSGLLKQMYIVENSRLEQVIGGVPVIGYFEKLNSLIVSTIHMINIFNHSDPINSTLSDSKETCRISTFGIADLEKNEEKSFFELDNIDEKRYYYAIPEGKLKTDSTLLNKVKEKVINEPGGSYGIYSTSYAEEYIYYIARTSAVQEKLKNT
tara:strand:- start:156 stop:992 length:837 start_codon:yes stop_codon:yes gene_type:complete